jgi:hypothetical protein
MFALKWLRASFPEKAFEKPFGRFGLSCAAL